MKNTNLLIAIIGIVTLLVSCGPSITATITQEYPTLAFDEDVIVLGLNQDIPDSTEVLGELWIDDSGFTVKCSYEYVIEKAKLEARKVGGNALKITCHRTPTVLGSTCHRIDFKILKVCNITDVNLSSFRDTTMSVTNYALLNIYRHDEIESPRSFDLFLGDTIIAIVPTYSKLTLSIKTLGENKLRAKTNSTTEIPVNFEFGKQYYLKCADIDGQPKLELVENKAGRTEFESLSTIIR